MQLCMAKDIAILMPVQDLELEGVSRSTQVRGRRWGDSRWKLLMLVVKMKAGPLELLVAVFSPKSCPTLLLPPWALIIQAPLSTGFSRPEYWGAQPFPSPGDLPKPGIEPRSPTLQVDSLPAEPQGKPCIYKYIYVYQCF